MSSNEGLVVIYTAEPELKGRCFDLDKDLFRIGRSNVNDLVLCYDSVARRHARLERRDGVWFVVDEGHFGGTFLNGEAIPGEAPLRDGDKIKIGSAILELLSGPDLAVRYREQNVRFHRNDGLTGIYNRQYFFEALLREILRGRREEHDVAVVLFDIDHMQRINGVHGHLAGDYVLKEVAHLVQAELGRGPVFARYGGEELAILLPETSLDAAAALADALRKKVGEHVFVFDGEPIRVTFSAGVTLAHESDRKPEEVMVRAEEQMVRAKREGRDRVCRQ